MSNKIQKRVYYAVRIRLCSPLNITGSESAFSDSDIIRNGEGALFVPGTSIAGALRNYLGEKKDQESILGFSRIEKGINDAFTDKGKMSSVYISDLLFDGTPTVGIRDGVSLTEDKGVENKYDMEIIETGAEGTFFLTFIIRENDPWEYIPLMDSWIQAINRRAIRFGKNKNRGLGCVECTEVFRMCFDGMYSVENQKKYDWITFVDSLTRMRLSEKIQRTELCSLFGEPVFHKVEDEDDGTDSRYIRIKVPLKLSGGISIRKYSSIPGKADYEQLTCNGVPVIPGTSWNGAIRSRTRSILKEFGLGNVDAVIEKWFGTIQEKEARQSMVVFSESVLKDSAKVPVVRNKINRFTAGTITGALYSELSRFGGTTVLEILVRKEEGFKELTGMMLLIAEELAEGFVPVGGLASVGRGVFEANGQVVIEGTEPEVCKQALYDFILQMKEGAEDEMV